MILMGSPLQDLPDVVFPEHPFGTGEGGFSVLPLDGNPESGTPFHLAMVG
jgi:hypothetical protein